MAREAKNLGRGFLDRSLADGARLFQYRSRIRALLGLPHAGGVEMNFPKPLPIAGFTYVVPRFRGEFELSDELFAGGLRHATRAEQNADSYSDAGVTGSERDSAVRRERDREATRQTAPASRIPKEELARGLPEAHTSAGGEIRAGEPDSSQRPSKTAVQAGTGRSEPVHKAYDEFVPGESRHSLQDGSANKPRPTSPPPPSTFSVPSTEGTAQSEGILPLSDDHAAGPRLPVAAHLANSSSHGFTGVKRPRPVGADRLTIEVMGDSPELLNAALKPSAAAKSSEKQQPAMLDTSHGAVGADRAEFPASRVSRPAGPLVAQSRVIDRRQAHEPLTSSAFPARRPEEPSSTRRPRPSETAQESSPSGDSRQPALAAAQPQVVVVKQSLDAATPIAFWERRYLNHLRVRVRR